MDPTSSILEEIGVVKDLVGIRATVQSILYVSLFLKALSSFSIGYIKQSKSELLTKWKINQSNLRFSRSRRIDYLGIPRRKISLDDTTEVFRKRRRLVLPTALLY